VYTEVEKMETETLGRFDRETRSFFALVIINIVGAGIAMSFGVATGVNNLIPMINERSIQLLRTAFTGLALAGFVFAIRWLILSAQLFSDFDDIRDEFKNISDIADDETLTRLIVQNTAFYRDRKPIIERLKLGSRATGAFFLLSGAVAALNTLSVGSTGPVSLLTAAFGTLLCIALGIVGVYSPSFFERYTETWERRLRDSAEVEKELNRILEGR
jgi:hypothetical protein